MAAEISVERLMAVMRDFDEFGGASIELVAWELGEPPSLLTAAWSRAIADGLLEPAGVDSVFGEPLWRLMPGLTGGERRPDVSVIVPARDAAATLGRTLAALGRQRFGGDFEVIVVDNGSIDGTAAVARAAPDRILVLERARGEGPAAARNAGAAVARAPILAFTDADCEPAEGWLAAGVGALDRADLVQGAVAPPPGASVGPFDRTVWVGGESLYEAASLFVRLSWWERVGGFQELTPGAGHDAPFGEDAWFGWRVRRAGGRAAFCPGARVHHAVFTRGARGFIAERRRLDRFPSLAARIPELRRERFYAGSFLSRRTAALDAALLGCALAVASRRPALGLAAAAPYAALVVARAARWGPRLGPRVAAVEIAADLVGAAALVRGSIAARSLLI
jgi:GT2 family glycosyltransferase